MQKEKSENLVVIVGNGFDLAHDLKTKFSQFAISYFEDKILPAILAVKSKNYPELLSESFVKYYFGISGFSENNLSYSNGQKLHLRTLKLAIQTKNLDLLIETIDKTKSWIYTFILKNKLLGKLYNEMQLNWFGIEQTYYKELVNYFNKSNFSLSSILKLNNDLSEIKSLLKTYLKEKIHPTKDSNVYYSFSQHFSNRKNVVIVNFNYTDTVNNYKTLKQDTDLNIDKLKNIHIHGTLLDEIIFGYGDDTDDSYAEMKNVKEKELLRNFKTYAYLKSTRYRELLNEIAILPDYDCLIIGHSLDTTDKTILKTILDSDKCDYIELLKRSDLEDYDAKYEAHFELHANLARIFSDEITLREKLISFDHSVNFPVMMDSDHQIIHTRQKKMYKIKEKNKGFDTMSM